MADGGASSAALQRLLELLSRINELAVKFRYESAAAKSLEAVVLARATTPPQSLLRAYALVRHAENAVLQHSQIRVRSDIEFAADRDTYAVEKALCAAAYASLQEALPILFARTEANTLLPGRMPADEEESFLRVVLLVMSARGGADNDSAAAVAARIAEARASRRGQSLGYHTFLEAAFLSFLALCPTLYDTPFPPLPTNSDNARQQISMMVDCVMFAVRWMGASLDGAADDARNGVQWQLMRGRHDYSLTANKLCGAVSMFLNRAQTFTPFRLKLHELWHSPQLASRRQLWVETMPRQMQAAEAAAQRADADIARQGLAVCARAGCGAVESCPKAFKTCARCHSVVYCSRDCQLAAWPSHKRDCKRLAAEREADDADAAA